MSNSNASATTTIITISLPKVRKYDLLNSRKLSSFSLQAHRIINKTSLPAIKSLEEAVESGVKHFPATSDEEKKIKKELEEILAKAISRRKELGAQQPIVIKVNQARETKSKKASKSKVKKILKIKQYNLRCTDETANLDKLITSYGKKQNKDKLISIQSELKKQQTNYPGNQIISYLIGNITRKLDKLNKPSQDHSYVETTKDYFKTEAREVDLIPTVKKARARALRKYSYKSELKNYIDKPVMRKEKTGEESFKALGMYALLDLFKNQNFEADPKKADEFCYLFIIGVLNSFSHISSIYPCQGHGRSKQDEVNDPGHYCRSELFHHLITFINKELKLLSKEEGLKSVSYGVQDIDHLQGVIGLLNETGKAEQLKRKLEELNKHGRVAKDVEANGLGPILSHVGSRSNPITQYMYVLKQIGRLTQQQLERLFHLDATPRKINQDQLKESIQSMHQKFKAPGVRAAAGKLTLTENLPEKFYEHRKAQAEKISTSCADLNNIKVQLLDGASCCVFRLFPDTVEKVQDDRNNRDGLTNVLMGFLGGLINYNARKKGLHSIIQYRQSFGFLRSTITGRKGLEIRLSLGLEPGSFTDVIIESVKQLNELLTTFDFITPKNTKNKKNAELIEAIRKPCEKKKGKTEGDYLLNSMRNIDDKWMALVVAQKMLDANSTDSCEAAFKQYLEEFILKRVDQKEITESSDMDHANIPRHGYAFMPDDSSEEMRPTLLTEQLTKQAVQERRSKNMSLLFMQNIIKNTLDYVANLKKIPESYTCYHLMTKLLHLCQKGMHILGAIATHEESHLTAKANLVIDNLLEYFPLFKFAVEKNSAKNNFISQEQAYFKEVLCQGELLGGYCDQNTELQIAYHDSGQQAIVKSILALRSEFGQTVFGRNVRIYLSDQRYYEVALARQNIVFAMSKTLKDCTVAFIDVTDIEVFKTSILTDEELSPKGVIIDITHNSTKEMLTKLREVIEILHKRNTTVVLANSCLKHEEAGQDKYQLGRTITLRPDNAALTKKPMVTTEGAMNGLVASFQSTVRSCFNESTIFSRSANTASVCKSEPPANNLCCLQ